MNAIIAALAILSQAPTGCTHLATVQTRPPYLLPNADIRDLKKQASRVDGADTMVVTHRGMVGPWAHSDAEVYRCGK